MSDSSEMGVTGGKSATGEMDDGSRFEVRGFRNFEPGTSNFESLVPRG